MQEQPARRAQRIDLTEALAAPAARHGPLAKAEERWQEQTHPVPGVEDEGYDEVYAELRAARADRRTR